jgi:hypothetical protein
MISKSGTPTAAGVFSFTVQVKDAAATTATKAFTLTTMGAGSMNRVGVLAQIASGGLWDTAIWLTNSSSSPVPISLKFHGDAGNDMSIAYTARQEGDSGVRGGAQSRNRSQHHAGYLDRRQRGRQFPGMGGGVG